MTPIRKFNSYDDACKAVVEAGFKFVTDSNAHQTSNFSYAPTITYRHPKTNEEVKVMWNSDRGYVSRF